ncbi:MAG: hypothetical protein HKM93_10410 [Desulfobacteraceae bacterium]|nr:hypothetical protein [Desulfobacteraceae bacterium]
MLRLVILFILGYLCYQMGKKWLHQNILSGRSANQTGQDQVDDVMVKDPHCQIYFPKRDGIHLRHDGEDLYFCKTECRDKFIAEQSEKGGTAK